MPTLCNWRGPQAWWRLNTGCIHRPRLCQFITCWREQHKVAVVQQVCPKEHTACLDCPCPIVQEVDCGLGSIGQAHCQAPGVVQTQLHWRSAWRGRLLYPQGVVPVTSGVGPGQRHQSICGVPQTSRQHQRHVQQQGVRAGFVCVWGGQSAEHVGICTK